MRKGSTPQWVARRVESLPSRVLFAPDGMSKTAVNVRIADRSPESLARPTSALLDGSALERRMRREEQRALNAVARSLSLVGSQPAKTGKTFARCELNDAAREAA